MFFPNEKINGQDQLILGSIALGENALPVEYKNNILHRGEDALS